MVRGENEGKQRKEILDGKAKVKCLHSGGVKNKVNFAVKKKVQG